MMTQVAGREQDAKQGKVVIQTYNPQYHSASDQYRLCRDV
jgi:primosomal protein N'